MNNKASLVADLHRLGVQSGDTLFLRISYRALGETDGGPKTLIDALLQTVGPHGTIIAAAFPKRQNALLPIRRSVYIPGMSITTGVVPTLMSKYEGAHISPHPTSPFVCIGRRAEILTSFHTPEKHNFALIEKAIEICSPKCLRIGGRTLVGTTHIAFSEALVRNHQYHLRKAEGIYYYDETGKRKFKYQNMSFFCPDGFERFCEEHIYSEPSAVIGKGVVGQGEAILTDMRTTLAIEREWIVPNPQILLCDNPECLPCRSAYSYSEYSPFCYIFELLKMQIKGEYTRGHLLRDIKDNLLLTFWGRKCQ